MLTGRCVAYVIVAWRRHVLKGFPGEMIIITGAGAYRRMRLGITCIV